MKKHFFYSLLAAMFSVVGFTSCGGDDVPDPKDEYEDVDPGTSDDNPGTSDDDTDMSDEPFTVTALGDNAHVWFQLEVDGYKFSTEVSLMYSYDKETWYNYAFDTPITFKSKGSSIYFKAGSKAEPNKKNSSFKKYSHLNTSNISMVCDNDFAVSGNILSLLYGDKPGDKFLDEEERIFSGLFYGCTKLVSAADLVMPVNTKPSCFSSAFGGCSKLKEAPALPAQTVTYHCYAYMFAKCTKLETAPELPAKATTGDSYACMFSDCTNLTKAPLIAATNIEGYSACYHMFENCSNLTYVKMRATSIESQSVEGYLLNAGNNASVIYVPKGMASNEVLKAAVPSNWTIVEED